MRAGVLIVAFVLSALHALAAPILFDVTVNTIDLGGGLTRYEYTITAPAEGNIYQLAIPVASGVVQGGSAVGPTSWDALEAPAEISWLSQDPSFDLLSLNTLPGFMFTASGAPVLSTIYAQIADPNTGDFLGLATASVLVPGNQPSSAIPEPSSVETMLLGLTAIVTFALFRVRRQRLARSTR